LSCPEELGGEIAGGRGEKKGEGSGNAKSGGGAPARSCSKRKIQGNYGGRELKTDVRRGEKLYQEKNSKRG